jgi:hypothetical protein
MNTLINEIELNTVKGIDEGLTQIVEVWIDGLNTSCYQEINELWQYFVMFYFEHFASTVVHPLFSTLFVTS